MHKPRVSTANFASNIPIGSFFSIKNVMDNISKSNIKMTEGAVTQRIKAMCECGFLSKSQRGRYFIDGDSINSYVTQFSTSKRRVNRKKLKSLKDVQMSDLEKMVICGSWYA